MAIQFQSAPGAGANRADSLLDRYFGFMAELGVPPEAFLTFVLVALFILAVFFFRADSFGSRRR